jgi:photosystem II stability/assembly factor-like uncharacterized protein
MFRSAFIKAALIFAFSVSVSHISANGQAPRSVVSGWRTLPTVAFKGKQDDLFFVSETTGWYGNGQGKLYKTTDGGEHWDEQWNEPGTFIRALGFVDEHTGILGNVGTDYFPGVTDETPLYRTTDGGATWDPVKIDGPEPKGICAIDVYRKPFVNHGVLGYKTTLRAGGRVGGPAFLLRSDDEGATWHSTDMSSKTAMILDIKFVSDQVGFLAGATNADVEQSHALVLRTVDGGKTWNKVYESTRPWEITWKLSFPSKEIGYVTVQNYDPAETNKERFVAKTVDGGMTWKELPVVADHTVQEFGIGFVTTQHGWLGGLKQSYETTDGGLTWQPADLGFAVNKIRIVPTKTDTKVFAIGSGVKVLEVAESTKGTSR